MSLDVTTYPPLAPEEVRQEDEITRVPQRVTQLPRPAALSRNISRVVTSSAHCYRKPVDVITPDDALVPRPSPVDIHISHLFETFFIVVCP